MISSLFPIVSTRDIDRALGFYRHLLGGTVVYQFPGPDGKPDYVGVDIGSSHVGISLTAESLDAGPARGISLWLYTDDCDATIERLRAGGARIVEEPIDQPWGERVARALDPDGNELIIGAKSSRP